MPEYLFVDYEEWGKIMKDLVDQLKRLEKMSGIYKFTHVYSPPRGGLPIAVHLSHHLNFQMINPDLDWPPDYMEANDNLLVIDDIVDTGETFKDIKEILDQSIEQIPTLQYKTCSLFFKPRSIFKPDIYRQTVDNDTWVVFPWECTDNCSYEKAEFNLKRKKELAIETGKPIITATQASEGNRLIWKSFLGEHE